MTDEIQPALTAEEWSDRALSEEDSDGLATCIDAQGNPTILTVTPLVPEPDDGWRVGMGKRQRIDIERRHALAALALYDQPFGFTHDDVARLRSIEERLADALDAQGANMIRGIAAKLAALLPPNA